MIDEGSDGYLVLILFILQKENKRKILALNKFWKILGKGNIEKDSSIWTLQEFRVWSVNRG